MTNLLAGEGSATVEDQPKERLVRCPCGEPATWYFRHSEADQGRVLDPDHPPNLCDDCFEWAVEESERERWTRVEEEW